MNTRDEIFSGTKEIDQKLDFDHGSLSVYLKNIIGSSTEISEIKQFKGGQSNPTYFIKTNKADYVVRRKPPGKLLPSAHAVDREYKVITALNETDVTVPKLFHSVKIAVLLEHHSS